MPKDVTVIKTVKVLSTTLIFVAVLYLLYRLQSIIMWTLVGSFLAIVINPAVSRISGWAPGKHRGWATGVVATLIIVALVGMMALFVPPLVRQTSRLVDDWPSITDRYNRQVRVSNDFPYKFIREKKLMTYAESHKKEVQSYLSKFLVQSLTNVSGALSSLGVMLTILAITVYMSVHGPSYVEQLMRQIKPKYRREVRTLGAKMYNAVTGYVNGNLLTSLIAGVSTYGVAQALGMPYGAFLGIVVALLDLIPMVGASIAAVVVVGAGLFDSPKSALIMLVFFVIYQQFENYVLVPKVMSKTVELSAFAVFMFALCGGVLGGLVGALVAIPVGACLQILVRYAYQHTKTAPE